MVLAVVSAVQAVQAVTTQTQKSPSPIPKFPITMRTAVLAMAAAFTLVPIVLIALYLAFVKRLGAFDAL